jgi:ABC-2 type transport system permease protein
VLSIIGFAAVAARIFRVGILMYGKRATLPEILRWVRQS